METYYKTPDGQTDRDFTFEDPFDIASADKLLARAIEEEIAQLEPGQPLVIISGECHDSSLDIMSHIGGIAHLQEMQEKHPDDPNRKFIVAQENPFDLSRLAAESLALEVPEELKSQPNVIDPDNKLAISYFASNWTTPSAPYSSSLFLQFIEKHSIPLTFVDAASTSCTGNKAYISPQDPLLKEALEVYKERIEGRTKDPSPPLSEENIDCVQPSGVAIRNLIMAERALKKAEDTKARIIFHRCGNTHVIGGRGSNSRDFKFEDSLAALYNTAGARVLPIYNGLGTHTFIENAPSNTLIRRGLDRECFNSPEGSDFRANFRKECGYLANLERSYQGNDSHLSQRTLLADLPTNESLRDALQANINKHTSKAPVL